MHVLTAHEKRDESNFSRRRLQRLAAWREIGLIPFFHPQRTLVALRRTGRPVGYIDPPVSRVA